MQRPDTFSPQAGFVLTKAGHLSDFDEKVAISLYQPLIGPIAMALYLSLWQEVKDRALVTDRRLQLWLLDLLDIDIDQLFNARVKLEAVGLLRTYTQVDSLGRYYAYELYAPVAPDAFFKDDLLGLLLYESGKKDTMSWLANLASNQCADLNGRRLQPVFSMCFGLIMI